MERYPTLRLIASGGTAGSVVLAALIALLVAWLCFPLVGCWGALAVGVVTGALVFVLALSYVELVRLIIEMLLPQ